MFEEFGTAQKIKKEYSFDEIISNKSYDNYKEFTQLALNLFKKDVREEFGLMPGNIFMKKKGEFYDPPPQWEISGYINV